MRKRILSEEQRKEVRELHEIQGYPYPVLAKKFDVSLATIKRICNQETYEKTKISNLNSQKKNKEKIQDARKNKYRRYHLIFHKVNEADLIKKIDEQDNVTVYIKDLIKKDMNSNNNE